MSGRQQCKGCGGRQLVLAGAAALLVLAGSARAHDVSAEPAAERQRVAQAAGRKSQVGIASVYARMLDGRVTASGELHDSDELVAAHRTLPLGTEVRVTNLSNHRSVVVRINDRGPQIRSRIIDLSPRAGASIGLRARGKGITRVRVDVLREPEPAGGVAKAREPEHARAGPPRGAGQQVADASSPLP